MRNAKPIPTMQFVQDRKRPVLTARPRQTPTDYDALRKDILKRYSIVMAELAK